MERPALPRRPLPIGIQSLVKLRESDCYYVDKTGLAVDLVAAGTAFFLSRPRRFGKSLLLDTFKELFEGHRALFAGLQAETRWDWSVTHPVIHLSFGGGASPASGGLAQRIRENLRVNRERLGLPRPAEIPLDDLSGNFADLIRQAHRRHGTRAVVLIDEYDKPILDHLGTPDLAREMRDGLRDFYATLKDVDADLRFVFLTGVSKFAKVSLFSGLNHLRDITLDPRWSALCGYTDADLDSVFAPELPGLDRDAVRRWYNGYSWGGTPVYNPFDVLLLFDSREFRPYWFETGTPTFLLDLLVRERFFSPDLARLQTDLALLSAFDVDGIAPEALLFQAGYLTIRAATPGTPDAEATYTLGYPNREVETSLNRALLPRYGVHERSGLALRRGMTERLRQGDPEGLRAAVEALFAAIPSDWYRSNPLAGFEGHYASVFYSHLAALGLDLSVEDATSHGRIDLSARVGGRVWIFEFKVVDTQPDGSALAQIRQRRYADKYRDRTEPIHLVGIEFGRAARNVVGFDTETIAPAP